MFAVPLTESAEADGGFDAASPISLIVNRTLIDLYDEARLNDPVERLDAWRRIFDHLPKKERDQMIKDMDLPDLDADD